MLNDYPKQRANRKKLGRYILQFAAVTLSTVSGWGALATDAVVSAAQSNASTTITTAPFSTIAPNELLLAFIATDAKSAGMTVTRVAGANLTWVLVRRANAQLGTSEIWRAFTHSTLSKVTVKAILSQSVAASITVVTFTGADPSGTNGSGAIGATGGGNANPGAPTATLVSTRSNSWVWGVGNDWDKAIARTVGLGQIMVHQYLASVGDTYWVQRQNSTTALSGTLVTINDTSPKSDRYNLSICEVLPAGSTGTGSITFSPAHLAFGTVVVDSSEVRSEMATNTGRTTVILKGVKTRGSVFSITSHPKLPYILDAGKSVWFKVKFAPQAVGYDIGRVTLHYKYPSNGSWYSTSRGFWVSGTGTGSLVPSPTILNFGQVQVSTTKTLSETLANSGSKAVTISQITASGAGFGFRGINPPVTLSSGQRATFYVSFRPQTSGSVTGNLKISSNAPSPSLSIPLSGTGSLPGKMAVSPSSINFGNVAVGTKKSQRGTVSAVNGPVTVSAANVSRTEFSVSGLSFPFTLSGGQTASYTLTFAPTASGSTSSTVTWHSSASNSPVHEYLTGSGTHSVALNWRADISQNIVGYNIYRGNRSGGPYTKINTALDTSTHDIDYKVQAGATYYYVVTAVNSAGKESLHSNQVKAVIPNP